MRLNKIFLIVLSVVITIWVGFCMFFSVIYWVPFTQVIKIFPYHLYIYFSDFGISEHFKAVTGVKLSLLFQRNILELPLFELVLEIPKSHFKVGEEISVKQYLINKSNYPITIVHEFPFPLFEVYDETDQLLYSGLNPLIYQISVLRPGQPYYGRYLLQKDYHSRSWWETGGLKMMYLNDGYRIKTNKPGVYTLKTFAEFEILDMKRYANLTDMDNYKKRVTEKKEIHTQPFRVYVED